MMMGNKSSSTGDIYEDDDDDEFCFYPEMSNSDKMYIFEEKIASLIAEDDKDHLVQFLRSPRARALVELNKADPQLTNLILGQCILAEASNCATAFLEGETGVSPYINKCGSFPLHAAAGSLSPKMTRYFLKFGLQVNAKGPSVLHFVRSNFGCKIVHDPEALPVDCALHSIRNRIVWEQGQSLFKLLVKLTGEGMHNSLEVVVLLMHHLSCSEITEVICCYAIEGKVVQLATLLIGLSKNRLMVDELYMPNNDVSSGDRLTLRQYVVNQIVVLENELGKSVAVDSAKLAKCKETKKSMMSTLMLLEIFLRAQEGIAEVVIFGDPFQFIPIVPSAIAVELEMSGFKLTSQEAAYLRGILDELRGKVKRYFPHGLPPLCSFATMKRKLEAIRFLAQNIEKINEIACCYAREGKLIELAIILMVAWEKVRDPFRLQIKGDDSARSMTFQQLINSELAQAVDLEYRLIRRITEREKELSMLCKQHKVEKEQVVKDVKKLLGKAGFKLKARDIEVGDINESSKDWGMEQLDEAMHDIKKIGATRKSGSRRQDLASLAFVLPCGFVERYGAHGRHGWPNDMKNFLFKQYPRECYNSSSQSYCASWASKAYCTSSPKAVEVQKRADGFGGFKLLVQKFPASKQLASVALAVRKVIKYA